MPDKATRDSSSVNSGRTSWGRRWFSLVVLITGCVGFTSTIVINSRVTASSAESSLQPSHGEFGLAAAQGEGRAYSRFSHGDGGHARLPCLLCHRREDNSPRPKLPGHLPCAGCHAQQFADSSSQICAICHTNAAEGEVKSFPPLRSFDVRFDHARHTVGAARPGAGCVACHKPERRGVALSIPAGFNAHVTCFQCHAPQARAADGDNLGSCNTCHQGGRHARTPTWSKAYSVGFTHARHGTRQGLNCNSCHQVRAGMPQRAQVTAPQPAHHSASARAQSCMTCHNGRRTFGGDDFSSCKRCHQGETFRFGSSAGE